MAELVIRRGLAEPDTSAAFVPHKPARPDKADGGRRFKIVSEYEPAGDQPTAIADLLGDVIVYCRSEALKYGLPLEDVLDVIMDSNESKLGADGNPIYDANGKFLKGPNYWKPEPRIKALLQSR